MQSFPRSVVLRHVRENLKKCSLRGLEARGDILFLTYPGALLPDLQGYILLTLDAPPLVAEDNKGIILVDATWRYAERMLKTFDPVPGIHKRSLPSGFRTAYPRRQTDCSDPERGLASVEALFIAYHILGYDTTGILEGYYWKDAFLEKNQQLLDN